MSVTTASARSPAIPAWIALCLFLVIAMVFIGGVTRLTESGLSIVEWKLLSGIFPPLTHEAWEAELEAYRQTPEYQQINRGMNVSEFKRIFWLEYIHRLLGRVIGLAIALPFAYFLIRRKMDAALSWRMLAASLLVGAQGLVGWVMVSSGLIDDPRVSPVKLALHLTLALIFYGVLLWTWMQLKGHERNFLSPAWKGCALRILTALLSIQIIFGALVAGLDAGLAYNTFPLMDGDWIPNGLWVLEPWHHNPVENITLVQFQHRCMAYIVTAAILAYIFAARRSASQAEHRLNIILGVLILLQFLLGVATLLHAVPLSLASAHQMMAVALLTILLMLCFRIPCKRATIVV